MHLPIIATLNVLSSRQREICHPWTEKRERQILISVQPSLHHFSKAEVTRGEFTHPGEHLLSAEVWGCSKTALAFCLTARSSWRAQIPTLKGLMLEPGMVYFPKLEQQVNPLKINVMRILLEKKILRKFNTTVMPWKYALISSLPCDASTTISYYISSPTGCCYCPTEGYWSHTTAVKKLSLCSLFTSVQMADTHITWERRLLRLSLHRSPTSTPKQPPSGEVPLAHTPSQSTAERK